MKSFFYSFFLLSLLNSCKNAESAIYILPENFEGIFAVIYSQNHEKDIVKDGRHEFNIPESRILLTNASFSNGWRNDLFLISSGDTYDTLKIYLPNMDTTSIKFDKSYYRKYTNNPTELAVNFRQIVNPTFNKFDKSGNKIGSCSFEYELITIGRAVNLSDSINSIFVTKLNKYIQDTLCK